MPIKDELLENETHIVSAFVVLGSIIGCGLILLFHGCRPAWGV